MLFGGRRRQVVRRCSFAAAVAVSTLVGAAAPALAAPADLAGGAASGTVPVSAPAEAAVAGSPVVGVLPRVLLAAALVGLVLAARARHQRRGTVVA